MRILLCLFYLIFLFQTDVFGQNCEVFAGNDVAICVGSTYTLNPVANNAQAPVVYNWNSSPNLSCTNCSNPVFSGTTTETLIVTINSADGCTSSDTIQIVIQNYPVASFTVLNPSICSNVPVLFQNNSTGSNLSQVWNFGEPSSGNFNQSVLTNPSHEYSAVGNGSSTYNVTLISSTSAGCSDTATGTVQINQSPNPVLIEPISNFINCGGGNYSMTVFDGTTTTGITNYSIIWGDGTPNYSSNSFPTSGGVSHSYTSSAVFTLSYIVTGSNGCIDTTTYSVANVTNPSIGTAISGSTIGCGPLTLCFPLSNFQLNHPSTLYIVDYGDNSPQETYPHPPPNTICHTYTTFSCGLPGNGFTMRIKAINACDSSFTSISPIRVYSGPVADFTPVNPKYCVGATVTFTNLTTPGYNSSCQQSTLYQWNFGNGQTLTTTSSSNPTTTYSLPGVYNVTLTTSNSCGSTVQVKTVCIESLPIPNFNSDVTSGCIPLTVNFSDASDITNSCTVTRSWAVFYNGSPCSPAVGGYSFVGGTNSSSVNPQILFTQAGNYTVRLTITNSCGQVFINKPITIQKAPQINLPAITAVCQGQAANPTASAINCLESIDTYSWTFSGGSPSSASTLIPGSVTYSNAGTYPVTFSATNACGTTTQTQNITVKPLPPALNPQVTSPVCVGQTANFTSLINPSTTYTWAGPNGFQSNNQNFSLPISSLNQAGTYTVFGTLNGCVGPVSSVTLSVLPVPVIGVSPTTATICSGGSVYLTASGATSYTWSPATGLSATDTSSVIASPTSTQTYTVAGSNGTCSGTASALVTVNPLPVVNAGADAILCNQPIATTFVGLPAGGTWSGPNVTSAGVFTPNGTGTFTLTYTFTNANGCTNSDQKIVTVNNPIQPNAGIDFSVCADAPNVTLTPSPLGGTWTGSNVSPSGIFDPTVAGSFPLVYSYGQGTCLIRDTLIVTVNALPIVDVGSDIAMCIDAGQVILSGFPIGGTWSGTATTTNGIFTPSSSGAGVFTLSYTYTNNNGCSAVDNLITTVNPLPIVNAGADVILCDQPIATTFIGSPAGGAWSGPNVTSAGVFIPNGTGTFALTYTFTNSNGCTNSDQKIVTVNNPTQPNAGADFSVCANAANVTLSPMPIGGTWTGPNVTSSGVFDPMVPGNFSLIYSFGQGTCLINDTLIVTVNTIPVVDAGPNFSACVDNGTLALVGSPPSGVWGGSGIATNGVFNPAASGAGTFTLSYTFTDNNGCSVVDNLIATVNPLPVVDAGADVVLCNQPIPTTFTGIPAGGSWSGANVTSTGIFTPNGTGSFTLTYTFTNANGCTNSDQKIVTVNNPIQPNAGADFSVCIDAPNVTLAPSPTGGTWTGSNVTSSGIFDPTNQGNFPLVYSFGQGTCLIRDTLIVTVNPLPIVDAGSNITLCVNNVNTGLTANPAGGTWAGPGIVLPTDFSPSIAGAGTHNLIYTFTDANGCTSSDNLTAIVNPLPIVNAGIDTTICNQPVPVLLSGTPVGGTWSGSGVLANGTFTPNITGTFTLTYTVTNGNGCTSFDTRNITVVNPVQANAGPDLSACIDAPNVQLTGTPATGTWSGVNTSPSGLFDPTSSGTFPLVLSNGSGNCLTRDTMLFTVHPLPVVAAGTDIGFCPDDSPVNLSGSPANGIWSGTGVTNPNLGTFNPGIAGVGVHILVYTFTNPITGCVNRDTLLATVHPFPNAQFTFNPIACVGVSVSFTNTTTLGNTYTWDFGDGNTSSSTSPNHTYANSGFFDIELLAVSAFGCRDSITQQVEVRVPPIADFTIIPDSACGPLTANFMDLSSGPSLTYSWNYGNGQISSSPAPITQVYNAGVIADTNYTVTLTLSNTCGTDSHVETVQVMPSPTAIFGINTNIGCSPLNLNFANNSIGLPDSYVWDFGDGTTGSQSNAFFQHVYTTGNEDTTYLIQLIVTNECGTDTLTRTVTVLPNQVNAFFNVDAPSGCVPHTVNFTQFSQGATFSAWDFGNGNGSTSYNATHTFTQPGTYTVSLFANDGCGFDTATAVITVLPSPQVDFSFAPDSVCINEVFTFTNLSTNVASVTWDFGDGNSSPLFAPQHLYTTSGTYQVTLSAVSQTNGCPGSITKPVIVSTNPVAAFTPNPSLGCEDLLVLFNNQSTSTNFVSWDFGDGNFSTSVSPSHTYVNPGVYTVKLYVENTNGCSDSIEQVITVYPKPTASFTFDVNDPCIQPSFVTFTNSSAGAMNYDWDFGNGTNSSLTNPSISFTTPGTYAVSLIASSVHGCKDTLIETITIYQQAIANFVLPDDSLCTGESVSFISSSQFANSVLWDFGNGFTSTSSTATYEFPSSGTYNVSLIAYGDGGCNDTLTVTTPIVIVPSPIADFSYVNEQAPDPLSGTVNFTNESSGQIWNFWEFGNGDTSSLQDPLYRYNSYGDFLTTLIVGNEYGCTDTAQQLVSVDFFYGLYIPNAISPGHGDFEVANFIPKGVGLKTFELLIYDDWGNLIWSTTALDADGRPTEHWDGTYQGEPVQQDAYVWKCTATFMNEVVWEGKEYKRGVLKRSGTITVIR